ncbi:MAG TPA: HAD family hydrolase [Actinomycetota bacterium]|jgi:D-glycero-D-manno-heptose 1,7-bisphosphate phosphatase|nr:HAD family hydrolase [Actinomycetota bacterium]
MNRAVFLDRDGVLIRSDVRDGKPIGARSEEEFEILPGVPQACEQLRSAGFLLIVVTNQPDIARGTVSADMVERLNGLLRQAAPLDDIRICPHDDAEGCTCRKPKPGLLVDAAADWDIDLARSFMVGDRWRDVEAGRRAGCRVAFIDHGYSETGEIDPDVVVRELREAADWILSCARSS